MSEAQQHESVDRMRQHHQNPTSAFGTWAVRPTFKKSRASAACAYCRFRKVRCNSENGSPCSNCLFEKMDCVMPQGRAKRKPYRRRRSPPPTAASRVAVPDHAVPILEPLAGRSDISSVAAKCGVDAPQLAGRNDLDDSGESPDVDSVIQDLDEPIHEIDWYKTATQSLKSTVTTEDAIDLRATGLSYPATEGVSQSYNLPAFVQFVPAECSDDDLDYLRRKGALTVPEPDLLNELLKNFEEFVHPCLPIIDMDMFQLSMQDPATHGKISLLLLQAVMFAGVPWADIKVVRKSGFLTREAMKRAFYIKAKVLYDASYENDKIAIVQALVILTHWWNGPNEQKDGYYWCSIALAIAKSIGLHRDAHNWAQPPSIRKLRRRLWWSCLMRDTITSLGANRAPRVKESDFTVSPLTFQDFDGIHDLASALKLQRWSTDRDTPARTQLSSICLALTKLCLILTKILALAYAENPIGHTGVLYPKQDSVTEGNPAESWTSTELENLRACDQELRQWREQVSSDIWHQSPPPVVTPSHEQALLIHRALLSMVYFVAIFCLHRPRVTANRKNSLVQPEARRASQRSMRSAADNMNMVMMDLYQVDLLRLLPATGISCILAVSWCHVFDLQAPERELQMGGLRRLEECKLALRDLVLVHSAAEWAIKFLSLSASHISRLAKSRRERGMLSASDFRRQQQVPSQLIPGGMSQIEAGPTAPEPNSIRAPPDPSVLGPQPRPATGSNFADLGGFSNNMILPLPDEDMFSLDLSSMPNMWIDMPTPLDSGTLTYEEAFEKLI